MLKMRDSLWLAVLLLAVAACGGPGAIEVIDVIPSLEEEHSSTKEIGPEGGEISATAEDGTRYTLSVPEGALEAPVAITMTPVSSLEGLPLSGGLAGMVDFEPQGLGLQAAATLRIERAAPAAIPEGMEATGLAYLGADRWLTLYDADFSPEQTTLTIEHFSGFGMALGDPEEIGRMRTRSYLEGVYDNLVEPELQRAIDNPDHIRAAANHLKEWLAQVQNAGVVDDLQELIDQGAGLLGTALANAAQQANTACVEQSELAEVLTLRKLADFVEALSPGAVRQPVLETLDFADLSPTAMRELSNKCATFTLTFQSRIVIDEAMGYWEVETEPIVLLPEEGVPWLSGAEGMDFFNGKGRLNWVDAFHGVEDSELCLNIVELTSSNFLAALAIDLASLEHGPNVTLAYNPGPVGEVWQSCDTDFPPFTLYQWQSSFCFVHSVLYNEVDPLMPQCQDPEGDVPLEFRVIADSGWVVQQDAQGLALVREYADPNFAFKEETTITIRHTPRQ